MPRLVLVAERYQLVDEARGKPRRQVGADAELGGRPCAGGEHCCALVDCHEERMLALRVERLHVVHGDERGIRARGRTEEMAASATPLPPEVDDALAQRARREFAHPRERLRVAAGDEVVESGLGAL